MRQRIATYRGVGSAMLLMTLIGMGAAYADDPGKGAASYAPVDIREDFASKRSISCGRSNGVSLFQCNGNSSGFSPN